MVRKRRRLWRRGYLPASTPRMRFILSCWVRVRQVRRRVRHLSYPSSCCNQRREAARGPGRGPQSWRVVASWGKDIWLFVRTRRVGGLLVLPARVRMVPVGEGREREAGSEGDGVVLEGGSGLVLGGWLLVDSEGGEGEGGEGGREGGEGRREKLEGKYPRG